MEKPHQIVELNQQEFEIPPRERTLGRVINEDGENIENPNISIRIGNRPLAWNLGSIYRTQGKSISDFLQIYDSYDVWLIEHNIGVLKKGGYENITHIGYEMIFDDSSTEIKVLHVLPNTEFIQLFEGDLKFSSHIGIDAIVKSPGDITKLFTELDFDLRNEFKIATSASIVCNLTFSLKTSKIQSIGEGSNYSMWQFKKSDKPLYGDDIKMYQIVLVEQHSDVVKFKARVSAKIHTWNSLPTERIGEWLPLECRT